MSCNGDRNFVNDGKASTSNVLIRWGNIPLGLLETSRRNITDEKKMICAIRT
jgi:hypothetical protein